MRGQFFTSRPGKKTSLFKLRSILTPFTNPFARHSIQQKIFQILKGIYVHWTFSTFKRKDLLSLFMLSSIKPSPTNRDAKWGMKLFSKIKQVELRSYSWKVVKNIWPAEFIHYMHFVYLGIFHVYYSQPSNNQHKKHYR